MPRISSVSPSLLVETRDQVFKQIQLHPDRVDPVDVSKLRNGSNLIERSVLEYLEDHVMTDGVSTTSVKIANQVMESLRWRKEYGVNQIRATDLPAEFYRCNVFELVERPDGGHLIIVNIGNLKRLRHWSNLWIKFIVYEMEKVADKQFSDPDFFNKRKLRVLADSSDIGFAQMDLSFILTIVPIFLKHFPQGFETVWLYGLPFFTRHMRGIALRSLPARVAKKVKFTDKGTIVHDMGSDNVPVRYGGTCRFPLKEFSPAEASPLRDVGRKNGITDAEINRMLAEIP